jgi:hypothetical protein
MPLGQQSTEKFEFILANDLTSSATEVGIEQVLSLDVATDGEIGSVGQAFGGQLDRLLAQISSCKATGQLRPVLADPLRASTGEKRFDFPAPKINVGVADGG